MPRTLMKLNYMKMRVIQRIKRRINIFYSKTRGINLSKNSFVHSSVDLSYPKHVSIGESSILYKQVSIYTNNLGSLTIGDNSHIAPFGYLLIDNNKIKIGDNVAIGPFCSLICHSNDINGADELFVNNYLDGDIIIGNNVFIGAQCTILPGTIIENNVVIAANSVVKGTVEASSVYGGTPAKKIKEIE